MKWRLNRSASSNFKQSLVAAIILALLVFFFLFSVLLGGRVWLPLELLFHTYPYRGEVEQVSIPWNPLMWDGVAQFGVWRTYTARAWRDGWIPLWNPHQGFGYPLYANSQSAIFYPLNLLHVWLGEYAFGWLAAWHLWWAGWGTWLLLRHRVGAGFVASLIGAVVYMFSLWMVAWQFLPTLPATASWLPWVVMAAAWWSLQPNLSRSLAWGIAMGMCLLAGHLQVAFYVLLAGVLAASLLSFAERQSHHPLWQRLLGLAVAAAIALAWSAPQLLPAVELSLYSHRRAPATAEGYSAYVGGAMPFAHLVTLFLPDFFGHPTVARTDMPDASTYWSKGNYAEFACFVGVPTLALMLAGLLAYRSPWRIYAVGIATLALMLALGTPLNALFYYGVPGFSGTGSPARALVLWAFGAAVLASLGMERLSQASHRQIAFALGEIGLLIATSLGAAERWTSTALGADAFDQIFTAQLPILFQGLALTLLAIGVVWLGAKKGWHSSWTQSVAIACVVGSLWGAGLGYNSAATSANFYPETPLLSQLKSLTGDQWRVFALQQSWSLYRSPGAILPPNLATIYGLYDLQVYDSLMPLHAKRELDRLNERDSAPVENGNMALGWRAPAKQLADMGVRYLLALRPLEERGVRLVAHSQEGYLYELIGARHWVRTAEGNECTFRWIGGNRLYIEVPKRTEAIHVLQTFYPGWKAYPSASVRLLGSAFQEVRLLSPTTSVQLHFAPDLLRFSLYLTLLAAGISVACVVANGRR